MDGTEVSSTNSCRDFVRGSTKVPSQLLQKMFLTLFPRLTQYKPLLFKNFQNREVLKDFFSFRENHSFSKSFHSLIVLQLCESY
jgi:hypothetical protein